MEGGLSESHSHVRLLKVNRELLVTHIRNVQCLVDNLLHNDYFSAEDAEIVCACPTQPDKVLWQGWREPEAASPAGLREGFGEVNTPKDFILMA